MTDQNTALSIYDNFSQTKEIANYLASSDLIPTHFQKKPSNVIIALEFAHRNGIAPFAAMQSMFVVHGRVGMSASMAISLARKHNVWKSLRYESYGEGENLVVKAIATLHDGSEVETSVSMQMAITAGWTKNVIYKSIPEQMLKYRAATFLIRTNFPEILFGLQTVEEIQDVVESKKVTQEDRKQAIEAELVTELPPVVTQIKEPVIIIENEVPTKLVTQEKEEVLPPETEKIIDDMLKDIKEPKIEFERDIEDLRSELLEYISLAGPQVFVKLGKDKTFMLNKIEATKSLQSMRIIYEVVKAV